MAFPQTPKFEPLVGQYNLRFKLHETLYKPDGMYGPYWICAVWVDNVEHTWYLNEKTHAMVKESGVRKDSLANLAVIQQMGQKGPYNAYEMTTDSGAFYSHGSTSQPPPTQPPAQTQPPQQGAPPPTSEYSGTTAQAPPETDRDRFSDPLKDARSNKYSANVSLLDKCVGDAIAIVNTYNQKEGIEFNREDVRLMAYYLFNECKK